MGNAIKRHGGDPMGGFTMIRNGLIRGSGLTPVESVVLNVLLSHADGWQVTHETIARDAGITRPTVKKAPTGLIAKQKLVVQDGKRGHCVFHVRPQRDFTVEEVANCQYGKAVNEASSTSLPGHGYETLQGDVKNLDDKEDQSTHQQKPTNSLNTVTSMCANDFETPRTSTSSGNTSLEQKKRLRAQLKPVVDAVVPGHLDRDHLTNVAVKAMLENPKVAVAHVDAALRKWMDRADAGPGLLKAFIDEAIAEVAAAQEEQERARRSSEDWQIDLRRQMGEGPPEGTPEAKAWEQELREQIREEKTARRELAKQFR